jgi:peptidoglycan/LPS O-acetylase OafA/YrhL
MFQYYLKIPDLDGPYWTLIIEMVFYLSILLLFQLKLLKYINMIGIILCSGIVISTYYFHDSDSFKETIFWMPLFQFLPLFFSGTVFYKIYTQRTNLLSNYLIIIFCLVCQQLLFPYVGRSLFYISWTEYNLMLTLYFILFTLFVNFKLNFIVNNVTLFFGKISFALYLTHQLISLRFIIPIFHETLGFNFWMVVIFINLPIVIGVASFITYKIEVPYSKRMREKLREKFKSRAY